MGYWLPAVWFHFLSVIKYVVKPSCARNEIWVTIYLSQALLFAKTTTKPVSWPETSKYLFLLWTNLSQPVTPPSVWVSRLGTRELSLAVSSLQLCLVSVFVPRASWAGFTPSRLSSAYRERPLSNRPYSAPGRPSSGHSLRWIQVLAP